jgi:penicillin-binding protein 1B
MDTETGPRVALGLEKVETAERPHSKGWWTLPWLPARLRIPACITVGVFLAVFVLLVVHYLRLVRMTDRRLAEGPFSMSTEIFAAPETIAVGESLTANDLAAKLERGGYTRRSGSRTGWFAVQPGGVEITPPSSPADGVQVHFLQNRISGIVSLRDHSPLQEYRLDSQLLTNLSKSYEERRLVHFSEIPQSLVHALTAAEDKRFFQHGGFDYRRALKAAFVDFRDDRKQQGASTLTMQLARALWLHPQKSWRRKADEILITLHLEHRLTKQQIFEDYANQIYFGRRGPYSINGFGAAARVYFGKELWQLDTAEAALLAGLVQRPSYYNPFRYPERAIARRNLVLGLMKRNGELSEQDYRAAVAAPLKLAPQVDDESETSYFLSMMNDELQSTLGESAGETHAVVTTLDPTLQRAAESAVRSGMEAVDRQLSRKNAPGSGQLPNQTAGQAARQAANASARPQVALIALDPRTGEIKALVGGRNYGASQLNHVLASRQPGSVFKPFVYAAAIETALGGGPKTFTPASLVSDEITAFSFGDETYQPKDYHGDYQGDVTLRTALAESLNVAAVSLAQQVGYARVVKIAREAGLTGAQPTPSVALGAYEATPLDIAAAYTVFANHGVWVKPTTIEVVRGADGSILSQHQPSTQQTIDPRVAYLIVNMMQEVLRSGTGAGARSQGFGLPAAGKTGTSRDGWFAGFTSELLCVVWVGFDDNRDLKLEGARSALPIWANFMKQAGEIAPYRSAHDFRAPSGVVSAQICSETGELAGADCPHARNEVFIAGTEPTTVCGKHNHVASDVGGEDKYR